MAIKSSIVFAVLILMTIFNVANLCVCEYWCDRCNYNCRTCYFCYSGYFPQFGHCVPCAEGCLGCDGESGSCTNCKEGYYWTMGFCEKDEGKDNTGSSYTFIYFIIGGVIIVAAIIGIVLFILKRSKLNTPKNYENLEV